MFSDTFINKLKSAKSVAVLTGAGESAESGVPTFRGKDGLWNKFKPEEIANFDAFIKNPELVWEWYHYRKKLMKEVKPNHGHYALVRFENYFPDFSLITQNIDNLHRVAGSKNIYELHGNILRNRCVDCNRYFEDIEINFSEKKVPRCLCGGLLRPDVVWFGEALPEKEFTSSIEATRRSELFFSIGTSAQVYPAASLPMEAKRSGAYVVEINIETTGISDLVDESIQGKSGKVLPKLVEKLGIS